MELSDLERWELWKTVTSNKPVEVTVRLGAYNKLINYYINKDYEYLKTKFKE